MVKSGYYLDAELSPCTGRVNVRAM